MFRVTNYDVLDGFEDHGYVEATNKVSEEFNRTEVERSYADRDIGNLRPDASFNQIEKLVWRIDAANAKLEAQRVKRLNLDMILSSITKLKIAFSLAITDGHTAEWDVVDTQEMNDGSTNLIHMKRTDFDEGVVEVWFNDGSVQFMYSGKRYELAYWDISVCAELAIILSGAVDDEAIKGQPFEKKKYKEITNDGSEGNGTDNKKEKGKSGVSRKRAPRNPG